MGLKELGLEALGSQRVAVALPLLFLAELHAQDGRLGTSFTAASRPVAPLCSHGCGNLAPIPDPGPQRCNPFPHTSSIIRPLPALGFHGWSGLSRGKRAVAACVRSLLVPG